MADGFFFWRPLARSHLICLQMTAAILLMHSWLLCALHVVLDAHLRRLPPAPKGRCFFFFSLLLCRTWAFYNFFPPSLKRNIPTRPPSLPDERSGCVTVKRSRVSSLSLAPTSPPPGGLFHKSRPLLLQLFSLHLHPPSYIFPLQMGSGWHFCTVDSLVIGFNGWCVDDVTDGGPARDPPSAVMFIAV